MIKFNTTERTIGNALLRKHYDLPFDKDKSSRFLLILICLMTILAVFALSSSFALSAMNYRWSSGLENKLTIEIPAHDLNSNLLSNEQILLSSQKILSLLENLPTVENAYILDNKEINSLIKPWLGDNKLLSDIPLPSLISVNLLDSSPHAIAIIEEKTKQITPNAYVDTHETWLSDVLKLTNTLKFAACILLLVIGTTTIIAVAEAIRSKMAEYFEELELLHIMGASDHYIAKQFQRYSVALSLKGSIIGVVCGLMLIYFLCWLSGEMEIGLLPEFTLNAYHYFLIMSLPLAVSFIAIISARITVMNVLSKLP
jgi:cell division transport system permease protein